MGFTDINQTLANIDHALKRWLAIRKAYGLTDEMVAEGKKILQEEKDNGRS